MSAQTVQMPSRTSAERPHAPIGLSTSKDLPSSEGIGKLSIADVLCEREWNLQTTGQSEKAEVLRDLRAGPVQVDDTFEPCRKEIIERAAIDASRTGQLIALAGTVSAASDEVADYRRGRQGPCGCIPSHTLRGASKATAIGGPKPIF